MKWSFHSAHSVTFSWSCLSYCSTGVSSCCPADPLLSITLLSSAFAKPVSWSLLSLVWILPLIVSFSMSIGIHPYSKGLSYKLARTWLRIVNTSVFCSSILLLGYPCSFSACLTPHIRHLQYQSCSCPLPPFCLSLQAGCSFTIEGHPVCLWAIFFSSEVFLNACPFRLKEY